jgi:hypothetical protein
MGYAERTLAPGVEVWRSTGWTPPSGGHGMALAFACASPAGVDEAHAEPTAADAGSVLAPRDAFCGMRYAIVHDPDGNPVDLSSPLG